MDNRTPLSTIQQIPQPVGFTEASKPCATSPLDSPRLSSGTRNSLPELHGDIVSPACPGSPAPGPGSGLSLAATAGDAPATLPLTPPGAPVPGQANASANATPNRKATPTPNGTPNANANLDTEVAAIFAQLGLAARDVATAGSPASDRRAVDSKQVKWIEDSPYKRGKSSVPESGIATGRGGNDSTTTLGGSGAFTVTTTATATSSVMAGASTPQPSPRSERKSWTIWSKGKENSSARPKLARNVSTPLKGFAARFSRQRLDNSPPGELSSSSPRSAERQMLPDARHSPSPTQTPRDRGQWKSPHAINSPARAPRGVAISPGLRSPLARTYSSLELPKFHRIDEPIVVISAWGTVVGSIKIHLKRCMEERPVDQEKCKAISEVVTKFADQLDQDEPDRAAMNKALLKLALWVRDVDSGKFHASYVLKYHIAQMTAAIEYMPDELPSMWRGGIKSDARVFRAWVLHGITGKQQDRNHSQ